MEPRDRHIGRKGAIRGPIQRAFLYGCSWCVWMITAVAYAVILVALPVSNMVRNICWVAGGLSLVVIAHTWLAPERIYSRYLESRSKRTITSGEVIAGRSDLPCDAEALISRLAESYGRMTSLGTAGIAVSAAVLVALVVLHYTDNAVMWWFPAMALITAVTVAMVGIGRATWLSVRIGLAASAMRTNRLTPLAQALAIAHPWYSRQLVSSLYTAITAEGASLMGLQPRDRSSLYARLLHWTPHGPDALWLAILQVAGPDPVFPRYAAKVIRLREYNPDDPVLAAYRRYLDEHRPDR